MVHASVGIIGISNDLNLIKERIPLAFLVANIGSTGT